MTPAQAALRQAIGLVAFVALAITCGACGYVIASRAASGRRAVVRAAAAAVACAWLLAVAFLGLASVHQFRLTVVLPGLLLIFALLARRWGQEARESLRGDTASLQRALAVLRWAPLAVLAAAVLACVGARVLRGSWLPPLAWDALTYHLVRAGRWVQSAGFQPEAAPDAWGYYEYLPPVGDAFWAWGMLPVRGDGLLFLAGGLAWVSCALGTLALASALGCRARGAALAACVACAAPPLAVYVTTSYVDNTGCALFLLGLALATWGWEARDLRLSTLACAALALAAGVKVTYVPLLLLVLVAWTATLARGRTRLREAWAWVALLALVTLPPLQGYFRAARETGNPFYPIAVRFAGRELPFNREFELIHHGLAGDSEAPGAWASLLRLLFLPSLPVERSSHLNLTPAGPVVLALGLVAAVVLLFRAGALRRASLAGLLAAAALLAAPMFLPGLAHYRSLWGDSLGRFLAGSYALLVVLIASVADDSALRFAWLRRGTLGALVLVGFVHLWFSRPTGLCRLDVEAGAKVLACGAPLAMAAGMSWAWRRTKRGLAWLAVASLAAIAWAGAAAWVRQSLRYEFYAAVPRAYDMHVSDRAFLPVRTFAFLDGEGARLAVTGGFASQGHDLYRYPLLGSRLQNVMGYVPVTASGTIVDLMGRTDVPGADFEAWMTRLRARRVRYVVGLAPFPGEVAWMSHHPEAFRLVGLEANHSGVVFELIGAVPDSRAGDAGPDDPVATDPASLALPRLGPP